MAVREESRARTREAILAAARDEIAEYGGGGLSIRRIARTVGLVPSALYRYAPSRDALLTELIMESYHRLADRLTVDPVWGEAEAWQHLVDILRAWAIEAPHEFQLIYGTPIPGYVAPAETVPAAARVAAPFLAVGARRPVPGFESPDLRTQMARLEAGDPSGTAAVLAELAAVVGFLSLELAGHFVGSADPADGLFAALTARQIGTLQLH
ncbi:TetR/AcrR family transcriptional regulator [Nocardioides sp.]|uniref:TetR/AcrR family transcriptional regulator n=1 Tax=Nocardioides sp. TaxID=35761 RepID=UPI00262AC3FF|nr:TetR/AcrR family transcriptional regulator [Nocardioides sp.]